MPRFHLLALVLLAAPAAFAQDVPVAITSAEGDTLLAIHDDGTISDVTNVFHSKSQLY